MAGCHASPKNITPKFEKYAFLQQILSLKWEQTLGGAIKKVFSLVDPSPFRLFKAIFLVRFFSGGWLPTGGIFHNDTEPGFNF